MSWLFTPNKTPKEQLKECKTQLRKNSRSLEREIETLDDMEKKILYELKPVAKSGKIQLTKTMCNNLVTVRKGIEQLHRAKGQLEAIQISLTVNHTSETMVEAMRGATKAMMMANSHVNVQQLQHMMKQYTVNSDRMEFKQELMNDTMDSMFENDGEESNDILNQIMDEIGVDMSEVMGNPPFAVGHGQLKTGAENGVQKV